jgi:3-hydroxyacyl-[acyl-carrier-protein] dehydratase
MRFLLVDEIVELVPGTSIVTRKRIDPHEDYLADHFPGYPVVPGVLQVEMMAQSAGKCLMSSIDATRWPVLIQVRQANFRKSVHPGAELRIEATIASATAGTASATAKIFDAGVNVADATLVFGFIDRGLLQAGFRDEVLAAFERRKQGVR